jgi:hypothetical protein
MSKHYITLLVVFIIVVSTEVVVAKIDPLKTLGIGDTTEDIVSIYSDKKSSRISTGKIVVDHFGNILDKSSDFIFDENDKLEVYVLGTDNILSNIKLEKISPIRDSGIVRVLGAEDLKRFGKNDLSKYRKFEFDSFAPGEGNIKISHVDTTTKASLAMGNIKLKVNPLYSGMFTLGVVRSDLVERKHKVANDGTNDIIIEENKSDEDYLYTLMYTPFIWGKRDIEKSIDWWERINPTLGISFEDIDENVFVGVSIDLPSNVLITGGWHFGKVTSISDESGLQVGDTFSGTIPTSEKWEDEFFVSISFDILAIKKLFGLRKNR